MFVCLSVAFFPRCGSQAIVGHWDDMMYIYGFNDTVVQYPYDGPFHIIPEMDCVRVISEMTHELIQKVPVVVDKILRINSTAPGCYLLEASKQFQVYLHLSVIGRSSRLRPRKIEKY